MKKNILLASLMLLALCFAGCRNTSDSTDLLLFELKGNVASVQTFYIDDVTKEGFVQRDSYAYDGNTLAFNEKGELIFYNGEQPIIERKSGNIVKMEIPTDFGGNEIYTYTWNSEGFPATEDYQPCEGAPLYSVFTYSKYDSCSLDSKKMYEYDDDNDEYHYDWRLKDSHGNWLVRMVTENHNGYISRCLEERTITYHNESAQEEYEWIYGTWTHYVLHRRITFTFKPDGRVYNNHERAWHSYTIRDGKIEMFWGGCPYTCQFDKEQRRIELL